ncbi:MAG: hypothetical protein JSV66_13270 [Trueperaceae bacterium]|nr:MAG: hypothetical protein JSV66_13270 [Trueperaceae bacterium]
MLLFSSVPGLVASVAFWALTRFLPRTARTAFLALSALVYIAFFFGPFQAATDTLTTWTLELMHLGATVPIVGMLLRVERG